MKQTLITAALSIIILSITTYIYIKIKFAKDEKEVIKSIYSLVSRIVLLLFVTYCSYILYNELVSDSPVTKKSIFIIVVNTLAIYQLTLINIQFSILIRLFDRTTHHVGRLLNIIERLSCLKKPTPGDILTIEDKKGEPK